MDSIYGDIAITALVLIFYFAQRRQLPKSKGMALRQASHKYKIKRSTDITNQFNEVK